jgi:hypothetical protein
VEVFQVAGESEGKVNVRLKDIIGLKAEAVDNDTEDFSIIAGSDFAGQRVTPDDVHAYKMHLCHSSYDRTFEKFPISYLQQFERTLPGKSVLPGHDTGALPLARFYSASLVSKMEDFPVPVSGRQLPDWWWGDDEDAAPLPGGLKADIVPNFESKRMKVTYLQAGYYFANDPTTEGLRKNIELGVYRDVSIGFRYDDLTCDICQKSYFDKCPHILGYEDRDGRLATGTYSGDPSKAEALEGSIVYLGAQPRARLIKQLQEGAIDPVACAATEFGEDLVALKEAEALARQFGHKQKSWYFGGLREKAEPELVIQAGGSNGVGVLRGLRIDGVPAVGHLNFAPAVYDYSTGLVGTSQILPSSSPAGERLEETLDSARAAVSGAMERVRGYAAKRAEDGRDISKDRYAQLLDLQRDFNALMEEVKPKSGVEDTRKRRMRMQAAMATNASVCRLTEN